MVKIALSLTRDLTLLSNLLYEGILFASQFSEVKFDGMHLEFPEDFAVRALRNLDEERIDSVRIVMAGNDNVNRKLFEAYGIDDQSRKTYRDLLSKVREYSEKFVIDGDAIELGVKFEKGKMLVGSQDLAAPQLFKVDRYTGISSLETKFTSQQLTIYFSKEILLLALLGIYSSFVTSVRQQNQYYFFLTFSPEEIDEALDRIRIGDREFVRRLFRTKDKVVELLSDVLSRTTMNEIILVEVYLNAEIKRLMERENLDKISTILFKVAPEGQTYKIYELIPITIYREDPRFYEIVRRYFRNPEAFLENLLGILSPDSVIFDALKNFNRYDEAGNVVKAVHGLYRFVILVDAEGWYEFVREIDNACRKLEGSSKRQERSRGGKYRSMLRAFA